MVVIEGIDPSSSAYETATHPSTSYHRCLVGPSGNDPDPVDFQSSVRTMLHQRPMNWTNCFRKCNDLRGTAVET